MSYGCSRRMKKERDTHTIIAVTSSYINGGLCTQGDLDTERKLIPVQD